MSVMQLFSWRHVRAALRNIKKCRAYYIGGTLCIDMHHGYTVGLNRSGRGFAFRHSGEKLNEITFLAPHDVQSRTIHLYHELKAQ